ncbi:MAG: plastocyanin/azurin family copper-binding protein [Parvularculaceae bacterium]|nr:plastocyanin/azurin family copper-binding protein [Parvularculaceae bacterium]
MLKSVLASAALALAASPALAVEHVIVMKTKAAPGKLNAFVPDYVRANVGDTIRIDVGDMGHNAEAMKEVWPAGVPALKGQMSKAATFTVTADGLYGIKCLPHHGAGMVALVEVGDATVTDAHRKLRQPGPIATKRWGELLELAAAQ